MKSSICRRSLRLRLLENTHFFVKSYVCHRSLGQSVVETSFSHNFFGHHPQRLQPIITTFSRNFFGHLSQRPVVCQDLFHATFAVSGAVLGLWSAAHQMAKITIKSRSQKLEAHFHCLEDLCDVYGSLELSCRTSFSHIFGWILSGQNLVFRSKDSTFVHQTYEPASQQFKSLISTSSTKYGDIFSFFEMSNFCTCWILVSIWSQWQLET